MSNLRIFGVLIALIGLLICFRRFRGPYWNRYNFLLLFIFNTALLAISLDPSLVNVISGMMNLEKAERGRLLALLIVSNIGLWFVIIYMRANVVTQRVQFDKLVRSISVDKYSRVIEGLQGVDIAVLIPAYNEAENLEDLSAKFPEYISGKKVNALVVDDGSSDDTHEVAEKKGFVVARNFMNRGGGAALRLGYDILRRSGVEICVTMDADGQHNPEEIPGLIKPILENRADFVIGSRVLGSREKDSRLRMAGVYLFSFVINRLVGLKITDPASGFRAFKVSVLDKVELLEDQYHTSELIIIAAKKGIRIMEQPIVILKRKHGESKKGKDLVYGFHFAKTVVRSWWR